MYPCVCRLIPLILSTWRFNATVAVKAIGVICNFSLICCTTLTTHILIPCTAENWTALNWTWTFGSVELSSVQFSAGHRTGEELRRPATAVSARRRFDAQRKTERNSIYLNWTIQFSWVQFSSVFRCSSGLDFVNRLSLSVSLIYRS